ncbi:putative tail subunit protein [Vibrio phage pVco-14]|nr:putative tail subunit protein [Vibrio phage pVco-14]
MADGSRHALYGVEETSYGQTPNNPAFDTIRITGTTLGLSKDSLQSNEIRSDRQIADFRLGANQVGGDINFELSFGSFDKLLQGVLLSENWAGSPEQIKAGVTRKSFTFVRKFEQFQASQKPFYIYRGVEINQMQLSVSANAMVTGTFSVFGASQELASDLSGMGTPTYNDASITEPVDSFTGSLEEGGSVIAVITEISLTLANGIEPRFVVGSKNSIMPSLARSNLTGSITAYFEDSTLVEKFINETDSSIKFELPDPQGNKIVVELPRIKYTGGQPDVTGEGPVTLTMPFQALLDKTAKTNIVIQRVPKPKPVTLTSFTLKAPEDTTYVGGAIQLTGANPQPTGAQISSLSFASSDNSVFDVNSAGLATAKAAGSATITATDDATSVQATKQLKVSYHKIVPDIWATNTVAGIDPNHGSIVPATIKGGVEPISAIEARNNANTLRVTLDGQVPYASVDVTYAGAKYTLPKGSGNYYEITNKVLVDTLHSDWADGQARPIEIVGVGTNAG